MKLDHKRGLNEVEWRAYVFEQWVSKVPKWNDWPREKAQCVMQHILKWIKKNIRSQFKDLKVEVKWEKWQELAIEDHKRSYYKNLGGNGESISKCYSCSFRDKGCIRQDVTKDEICLPGDILLWY